MIVYKIADIYREESNDIQVKSPTASHNDLDDDDNEDHMETQHSRKYTPSFNNMSVSSKTGNNDNGHNILSPSGNQQQTSFWFISNR